MAGERTFEEQKLLRILREKSVRKGDFTLASGQKSSFFIDVKSSSLSHEGYDWLGPVLWEKVRDLNFTRVGGLQMGALPLSLALMGWHTSFAEDRGRDDRIDVFSIRPQPKDHGTEKRIEGYCDSVDKVLIVEDVCTTGGSSLKAVEAVRAVGAEVVAVLALVDRQQGAGDLFRQQGIPEYRYVYTIDELLAED